MIKFVSQFVCAFFIMWSGVVCAASQIEVQIKGDTLNWSSTQTSGGGIVPAIWDLPANLPVAEEFVPGGLASASPTSITMASLGQGGPDVILPVKIIGMEYQLSSNAGATPDTVGLAESDVNTNTVSVVGNGIGNQRVKLGKLESPFVLFRPIIENIDLTAWQQAFKDAGATEGDFRGTLFSKAQFDYYRDGVRIRYNFNFTLNVAIRYSEPVSLSINVYNDTNAMEVSYYYPDLVRGQTSYKISAMGQLNNDIVMSLVSAKRSGELYVLSSSLPENTETIPYSVECESGCGGILKLVDKGNSTGSDVRISATGTNYESETPIASLKVSFEDEDIKRIGGDVYTGTFIVMFKQDL